MSRLLLSALLMLACAGAAEAQTVPEYRLKAELIERFTRFVDWPSHGNGPFVIAVIGRNPFGTHLHEIASTRRIKGRPLEVRYHDDITDIDRCDILFIASSEKRDLREILARTASRPILTVGDTAGFGAAGVIINFYNSGDTVRFEINEAALDTSGLRASSKLLKLARIVEGEGN
jgi:hypothetical protein